jgi:hypothetical protein
VKQLIELGAVRIGAAIQNVYANVDFDVLSLPGGSLIAVLLWLYARVASSMRRVTMRVRARRVPENDPWRCFLFSEFHCANHKLALVGAARSGPKFGSGLASQERGSGRPHAVQSHSSRDFPASAALAHPAMAVASWGATRRPAAGGGQGHELRRE